jgi:hypothetical protein
MASRSVLVCLALLATSSCALMPRELNLAPLWFHRLDEAGAVLEWDACWPLLHYERTPDGGDDFRIRPLYRRVTEPQLEAVEHQFLWPLGRVRVYPEETSSRLFPLWSWRSRPNDEGTRDTDWYVLFPFVWGGTSADDRENYFAILPLFGDIPQFLTYDRFRTVLFPLYVGVDKGGHRHHLLLWPFVGFSSCAENGHQWFRVLPFYGHDIEPGKHDRRFVAWPFIAWSTENVDGDSGPVDSVWLWPLLGWRTGPSVSGWMALWPLFQSTTKHEHFHVLTLFWPFFRYYWNRAEDDVTQWWLWPFVGRVTSDDQRAWTFLWPLIWWREYDDPDGHTEQQWVLPFFWRVVQEAKTGERERFVKLWPLLHHTHRTDANGAHDGGEWSVLSIWPWRDGNAYGVQEAYGWIWELARGVRRARDDDAVDVVGRLFTTRERQGTRTASVPFLGSYEQDRAGNVTLRLFQFLPIPLGGGSSDASASAPAPSTR